MTGLVAASSPLVYELFGLRTSSALKLPLRGFPGDPDVEVVLGPVRPEGELIFRSESLLPFGCYRTPDALVLDWPKARFSVHSGGVVVETHDPDVAVPLLLQPVWAMVLARRGRESFHACVVERRGRALAILGHGGSGKTTAGLALIERRWRLVTDDLLTFDDEGAVVPGPSFSRLVPGAASGGRRDGEGRLRHHAAYCPVPVALGAALVLDRALPRLTRLTGTAAAGALLSHVYVPLLTEPGQARRRWELAADLAQRIPIYGAPPRTLGGDDLIRLAEEAMG